MTFKKGSDRINYQNTEASIMENKKGKITGLAHIGVFITDIERSIAYYTEMLDFECYHRVDIEDGSGVTRIAFLRNGSCIIELVQKPDAVLKPDGPIDHIAMDVDDIDAAMANLKAKGIEFETDEPVFLPTMFNGVKYALFRGPDGEHLEINQLL
jgi:lactoylglutathione lyase